jgi:glycosyltransferase involved in cell wall biosynthesis
MAKNLNNKKIKFSLTMLTYNDAAHLDESLKSLSFCEEKIVVDMGSSDDSVKIAKKNKAKVFYHKRVDTAALLREYAANLSKNDWLVIFDPDEIFPNKAIKKITAIINSTPNVGIITLQRLNYFFGTPVKYGRWGLSRAACPAIVNKKRVNFRKLVHKETQLRDGFQEIRLTDCMTKHYWVDSMEQFYEKHTRYLKLEGKGRYKTGKRFSYLKMYFNLLKFFLLYYLRWYGFLDKKNGWTLMKLALWYEKNAWLSLKKYQEALRGDGR